LFFLVFLNYGSLFADSCGSPFGAGVRVRQPPSLAHTKLTKEIAVRAIRLWGLSAGLALAGCAAAHADPCPIAVDQTQLQLEYDQFDAAGWRELIPRGCGEAAVAQLDAYRSANTRRLTPERVRELRFHAGQALAMTGHDAQSISHFELARGGDPEWSAYVEATLSFLRRDSASLARARAQYAAVPNASSMRLAFIDGFVKCSDQTYSLAVHCALAGMHH
jgi:hypothetical protein